MRCDARGVSRQGETHIMETDRKTPDHRGEGLAVGISIGVAIGGLMDNLALGMALGVALGVAIGLAWNRLEHNNNATGDEQSMDRG